VPLVEMYPAADVPGAVIDGFWHGVARRPVQFG
jgi:hypothetical protein